MNQTHAISAGNELKNMVPSVKHYACILYLRDSGTKSIHLHESEIQE